MRMCECDKHTPRIEKGCIERDSKDGVSITSITRNFNIWLNVNNVAM